MVLDTNVLVRATKSSTGPARQLLARLNGSPHCLVTSSRLLAELMRVLEYPRLQAIHQLSRSEIAAFVSEMFRMAEVVSLGTKGDVVAVRADPDDDPVILTAVEGNAEVICTLDRHFHHPEVLAYCAEREVRILSDVELLRLLREA